MDVFRTDPACFEPIVFYAVLDSTDMGNNLFWQLKSYERSYSVNSSRFLSCLSKFRPGFHPARKLALFKSFVLKSKIYRNKVCLSTVLKLHQINSKIQISNKSQISNPKQIPKSQINPKSQISTDSNNSIY